MHISLHEVGGQTLRVGIRPGEKKPASATLGNEHLAALDAAPGCYVMEK